MITIQVQTMNHMEDIKVRYSIKNLKKILKIIEKKKYHKKKE